MELELNKNSIRLTVIRYDDGLFDLVLQRCSDISTNHVVLVATFFQRPPAAASNSYAVVAFEASMLLFGSAMATARWPHFL